MQPKEVSFNEFIGTETTVFRANVRIIVQRIGIGSPSSKKSGCWSKM